MLLWDLAASAALGALLQEILWWWSLRRSLEEAKYEKLLRSKPYWAVTALFVLISGAVALVWFQGKQGTPWKDALIFGAFLPLVIKQAGKGAGADLGSDQEDKVTLRNYLGQN
jgi:hypothetical protein